MNEREQLEQKLSDLEAQKVTLFDSGSADQVEVGRLNEQIKAIRQQLSEIENQQTVETTANEIASSMETYNIGDSSFTIDQLAADEDAAKILRKGIAEKSQKQAQKWLEDINTQKAVYEQKVAALTAQLADADKAIDELQSENAQLQIEKDDIAEKRDAAVRSAEEAQSEVARLNSHVDDLRKEIAVGATNAPQVIDITTDADLEAAAQRLKAKKEAEAEAKKEADKAARVRIYGVQQLDGTGAKFGAYRADDDVHIQFGWLEKNKYVELSNEELERFREELEATKQAELESTPEAEIVDEPVSDFRPESGVPTPDLQNVDTGHIVDEHSTTGQDGQDGTGGVVTREEFEALKAIVHNHELFLSMKSELAA
jgi:regulator of replication initiation timing